jgi:hypothetical protein
MKSRVLECFPWEHDQLAIESVFSEGVIQRIGKILNTFQSLLPYDPLMMKLLLIVLALSSRISPLIKKEEYNSADFDPAPKDIFLSQNYYVTLLWKYVMYRLGYNDAIIFSVRFIQNFLRRQIIDADVIDIIQNRDDHGQLIQLMQDRKF